MRKKDNVSDTNSLNTGVTIYIRKASVVFALSLSTQYLSATSFIFFFSSYLSTTFLTHSLTQCDFNAQSTLYIRSLSFRTDLISFSLLF